MPHLPGQTACELNPILALLGSLRWCHTDLGANALRWPRLVREDRRLSAPAGGPDDMADDHNDGLLAQALLDAGMSSDATATVLLRAQFFTRRWATAAPPPPHALRAIC